MSDEEQSQVDKTGTETTKQHVEDIDITIDIKIEENNESVEIDSHSDGSEENYPAEYLEDWELIEKPKNKMKKKFKCRLCNFCTAYKHSLVKHGDVHRIKKVVSYKCDRCPFISQFKGHIRIHLAKIHNVVTESPMKCENCSFSTEALLGLKRHISRSRQTNPIKCDHCDFETLYLCEYKMHNVSHRGKSIKFNCEPNKDTNQSEQLLKIPAQFKIDKSKKFLIDTKCEVNMKTVPVKELSKKDNQYQCTRCPYTARYKSSVQRHFERRHTDTKIKPYKCLNCDFCTKTKDQIALHNRGSRSDSLLHCKQCSFTTLFKCQYGLHKRKEHNPYKCKLCNYSCSNAYSINIHFAKTHLNEGLTCNFCDFKTSNKEKLEIHESLHTGVKPFKCSHCEYSCVRNSLLVSHVKKRHRAKNSDPEFISYSKIDQLKFDGK